MEIKDIKEMSKKFIITYIFFMMNWVSQKMKSMKN